MGRKQMLAGGFVAAMVLVGGTTGWAEAAHRPAKSAVTVVAARAVAARAGAKAKPPGADPCSYPPVRTPTLVINGPAKVKPAVKKGLTSAPFAITGTAKVHSCAIQVVVDLWAWDADHPVPTIVSTKTSDPVTGIYTFDSLTFSAPNAANLPYKRWYQAMSRAETKYYATGSNVLTVTLKK